MDTPLGERAVGPTVLSRMRNLVPILVVVLVVILAAMLPVAIFLTAIDIQWIAFLVGVLVAASLALASRASRSRWLIARRTAQLKSARTRLAQEAAARIQAQELLAANDRSLQLVDRSMPVMLAYVDAQRRVRYHNRAFAEWAGNPSSLSDECSLGDAVGPGAGAQMEAKLGMAFSGHTVRCDQALAPSSGQERLVAAQYVPHFGDRGGVLGVFVTLVEVHSCEDMVSPLGGPPGERVHGSATRDQSADDACERIALALAHDDFSLYLHEVVRINAGSTAPEFHEVLLRLDEEEEYHLPPGTFLAQADECGMLPALDAWQVRNAVKWLGADPARRMQTCGINVSSASLADAGFVEMVRSALREHRVSGRSLCLETGIDDLESRIDGIIPCIQELKRDGCRFSLTGFGRGPMSLKMVRELDPDYLKIDAGIVLGVLRSDDQAARLVAINRVAHAFGASTIAECVEDRKTLARLVDLGVDFAQGSAISSSRPLRCEPWFGHAHVTAHAIS